MKDNLLDFWHKTTAAYKKLTLTAHLKIVTCLLLIPMLISLFLPFLNATAEFSLKGQAANNVKSVEIISPENEVTSFSAWDMLSHKELTQYEIYGTKISDYNVFGVSVYNLLTTPIPNYGVIDQISSFINSDAVDILKNDDIKNFLKDNFGDIGQSISDVMDSLSLYIDDARNIADSVKNISNSIHLASDNVRNTIDNINETKSNIEWAFYSIPILAVLGCGFMFIRRKPTAIPAVIFTILLVILAATGFSILIANNIIESQIASELSQLNTLVSNALNTYVPNVTGILALLGVSTDITLGLYLNLQSGYFLALYTTIAMTLISYFMIIYSNYKENKKLMSAIKQFESADNSFNKSTSSKEDSPLENFFTEPNSKKIVENTPSKNAPKNPKDTTSADSEKNSPTESTSTDHNTKDASKPKSTKSTTKKTRRRTPSKSKPEQAKKTPEKDSSNTTNNDDASKEN